MPAFGQVMDGPIPHWRLPSVNERGQLCIPAFWRDVPEPIPGWLLSEPGEVVPPPKMQRGPERPSVGGAGSVRDGDIDAALCVADGDIDIALRVDDDEAQERARTV